MCIKIQINVMQRRSKHQKSSRLVIASSFGQWITWRLWKNNFQCSKLFVCFILKHSSLLFIFRNTTILSSFWSHNDKSFGGGEVSEEQWYKNDTVNGIPKRCFPNIPPEQLAPFTDPPQTTDDTRHRYHQSDILNGAPKSCTFDSVSISLTTTLNY